MLYLKCTGEVCKLLGLSKEELAIAEPNRAPLGNWYIHRFNLGRRKAFVFMSESTLLSFVLLQGKTKLTTQTLPLMLIGGIEQLLRLCDYSEVIIARALELYQTGRYAKTANRADLGNLNDIVSRFQSIVYQHGGVDRCDLTSIIMQINQTPQKRLGWADSLTVTESKLGLLKSVNTVSPGNLTTPC